MTSVTGVSVLGPLIARVDTLVGRVARANVFERHVSGDDG